MNRTPAISVMLPSRGRPESLADSLSALLALADDPGAIEILVAVDPDDYSYDEGHFWSDQVRFDVMPQRYGYSGLHHYYNQLAANARGHWLLVWNDDATMLTPGWDTIIRNQRDAVLWMSANHCHGGNIFPSWPRSWTAEVGYISRSPNVDVWIGEIGNRLGRHHRIPVDVFHDRKDVTGGHDDQTYAEGRGSQVALEGNHPDHDLPENCAARIMAAEQIRDLLARGMVTIP